MKLKSVEDVNEFMKIVDLCVGDVFLSSQYGDKYNLKSKLTQFIAIGEILGNADNSLELWCSNKSDEQKFLQFFFEHPYATT